MVTVIIPNYNHEPYLEQRIESVLNQIYRDFEVIILDDCSTDNSREVIEQYRGHDKISQIVYNEHNSGSTFKQWEKGISLAKGEWIWIAESDDWCELTFLEELLTQAVDNDDVSLVFCNSLRFKQNEILYFSHLTYLSKTITGNEYISDRMIKGNTIMNASMAIFKKTKYDIIPNDWMNYKYCGDWLFWIYIMLGSEVIECGKVLNYFRTHDGNVSNNAVISGLEYTEKLILWRNLWALGIINDYQLRKLAFRLYNEASMNSPPNIGAIKTEVLKILGKQDYIKFKIKCFLGRKL
jgi:glycosyltransferase involved in cell wall biosynthesis